MSTRTVDAEESRGCGEVDVIEATRNAHRIVAGKPVRSQSLGTSRVRSEVNIKVDLNCSVRGWELASEALGCPVPDPEGQPQSVQLDFDHNWRREPYASHVTGYPALSSETGSTPICPPQLPLSSCQVRLRTARRSVGSLQDQDSTPVLATG